MFLQTADCRSGQGEEDDRSDNADDSKAHWKWMWEWEWEWEWK